MIPPISYLPCRPCLLDVESTVSHFVSHCSAVFSSPCAVPAPPPRRVRPPQLVIPTASARPRSRCTFSAPPCPRGGPAGRGSGDAPPLREGDRGRAGEGTRRCCSSSTTRVGSGVRAGSSAGSVFVFGDLGRERRGFGIGCWRCLITVHRTSGASTFSLLRGPRQCLSKLHGGCRRPLYWPGSLIDS